MGEARPGKGRNEALPGEVSPANLIPQELCSVDHPLECVLPLGKGAELSCSFSGHRLWTTAGT